VLYARKSLCLTALVPVSDTWFDSKPPPSAELKYPQGIKRVARPHHHVEEDTLGVFRLGRVKSLETLGTMVVVIGLY